MEVRQVSSATDPSVVLKKIEKAGWAFLGAFSIGGLIFASSAFAVAIAVGGILGLGNLRGMDLYFARVFRQEGPRIKWWHHVIYGARFLVLLAAVAGAIAWGHLPVVGVIVGLSVPIVGIIFYASFALVKGEAAARA
ncbi:hypothetical protein ACFLQ0_02975 [Nitrospinota bacterium]